MGLFFFVMGRWGHWIGQRAEAIMVAVMSAIGRVPVRYVVFFLSGDEEFHFRRSWVPKGEVRYLQFHTPVYGKYLFLIQVPSNFKLHFPNATVNLNWTEKKSAKDHRSYKASLIMGSLSQHGQSQEDHCIWTPVIPVVQP